MIRNKVLLALLLLAAKVSLPAAQALNHVTQSDPTRHRCDSDYTLGFDPNVKNTDAGGDRVNISRDQAKGIMVLVVIGGSLMTFSWLWLPHEFFVRYQLYPMGMLLTVAGAAVLAHLHQRESEHRLSQVEAKVADAKKQTQEQSQRAKPAWDLASANLELYFERNRAQVSQVFRISIVVMAAGFFVVLFSVYLALQNRGNVGCWHIGDRYPIHRRNFHDDLSVHHDANQRIYVAT